MRREEIYANRHVAGLVKRYHTWPNITTQTVAEHCCRAAQIYVEVFGLPRAEVLYYILWHDGGEQWSGDVPYSAKIGQPVLKQCMNEAEEIGLGKLEIKMPKLTEQEWMQFKICDILEMYEFGCHEVNLGNQYALCIKRDTQIAAQTLAAKAGVSDRVNDWLGDWRGRRVRSSL